MHPGRTAMILLDDQEIGFLGQVHPSIAKDYEVSETYVAELNLDQLLAAKTEQLVYQPVSKFPSVTRDMALLLDETIDNQSVMEIIRESAGRFKCDSFIRCLSRENIEAGKNH